MCECGIRIYKGKGQNAPIEKVDCSLEQAEELFNEAICAYSRENKDTQYTVDWYIKYSLYKRVNIYNIKRRF